MICRECGNDEAAEDNDLCPDCLIGAVPDGWYVLWCPRCLASLTWTEEDADTYPDEDWGARAAWAADQAHPDTCFGVDDADAAE